MSFAELFSKIRERNDLTFLESQDAVLAMMEEKWNEVQTGAFLTALHMKGETAEELAGFATLLLDRAVLASVNGMRVIDTCGTGGDRKGSLNISTMAAFVLAGCGIPVVKHGNHAVSSSCGSADLLAALGMRFRLRPEEIPDALERTGFAFLFAPDYHPATRKVASVRSLLASPTIFNLLGPLCNPARPSVQVVGVYEGSALAIMAEAFRMIHPKNHALFVHSIDGTDEATTNHDFFLHPSGGVPLRVSPSQYGFRSRGPGAVSGGKAEKNARIALMILSGNDHPASDSVLLNAILAYQLYYPNSSLREAQARVQKSIHSGAALQVVKKYKDRFPGGVDE